MIFSQGGVDQAWQTIRNLSLIVQTVVWILFLPVMIGLWIRGNDLAAHRPAGWNLFMFLPRTLHAKSQARRRGFSAVGWR